MVTLLNTIEDDFARQVCLDHGDKPDELLEVLHGVQSGAGFLSDAALRTIALALNISRAEVHGVVSFYHDFRREPGAKLTIKICRAEACQAVGADALIDEAEAAFGAKLDGDTIEVGLEASFCLGNCALGPAVMIENKLYGRMSIDQLTELSKAHREAAKS